MTISRKQLPDDITDRPASEIKQFIMSEMVEVQQYKDGNGCIYFLLDGEEVVYVGQTSTSFMARFLMHQQTGKQFTHAAVFLCPRKLLSDVEAMMIFKLRPKYNLTMPSNQTSCMSKQQMKRFFRCDGRTVNKMVRNLEAWCGWYNVREVKR